MERIDPTFLVKHGGIGTCSKAWLRPQKSLLWQLWWGRWHQVFVLVELVAVVEMISRAEGGCDGEVFWSLGCMESLRLHREVWGFEMPLGHHWCTQTKPSEWAKTREEGCMWSLASILWGHWAQAMPEKREDSLSWLLVFCFGFSVCLFACFFGFVLNRVFCCFASHQDCPWLEGL